MKSAPSSTNKLYHVRDNTLEEREAAINLQTEDAIKKKLPLSSSIIRIKAKNIQSF